MEDRLGHLFPLMGTVLLPVGSKMLRPSLQLVHQNQRIELSAAENQTSSQKMTLQDIHIHGKQPKR